MVDGETTPPPLLQEADLISLMDKHGIGEKREEGMEGGERGGTKRGEGGREGGGECLVVCYSQKVIESKERKKGGPSTCLQDL